MPLASSLAAGWKISGFLAPSRSLGADGWITGFQWFLRRPPEDEHVWLMRGSGYLM